MNEELLNRKIQYLKGVGPKRAAAFALLGIKNLNDLVNYYPRTYEDRSVIRKISDLSPGEKATVFCMVTNIESRRIRRNLHVIKAVLTDGTGYINVVWFNQAYLLNKIKESKKYWFYGKVERKILFEMANPVFSENFENFAVILPIYNKNKALTQNVIRSSMKTVLSEISSHFNEIFPTWITEKYELLQLDKSIRNIHFPESNELFYEARKRLVFQEFFLLQTALLMIKTRMKGEAPVEEVFEKFSMGDKYIGNLGFELTGAQIKVIVEIRNDFKSGKLMHRLVQGDVGSGKTAVAAVAISDTVENGCQAAFMAPTEILARQHYDNLRIQFEKLGIKTVYLNGGMKASIRNDILEKIKNNEVDVVIGTHALIQKDVQFSNLGLVITDEQHRFGVNQRNALAEKGKNPHTLVLTATPIPRTLALILYGDLDISVIDEMPPGRKKIETYTVDSSKRRRVMEFAAKRIKEGSQVYVVCPRIDEDDSSDMMSAEGVFKEFSNYYSAYKVDLIHGKMKSSEKDMKMKTFYEGKTDILVSTTVIEVGINVANATLMIIENAERFGLAQLHQLRGRVGRGRSQSYCIMISRSDSTISKRRMEIMKNSTDGFYISEQDLVIRGQGEFFGTRQHGLPEFKIANIYTDMDLLKKAQSAAVRLLEYDPELLSADNINIMKTIESQYGTFITI